MPRKIIIVGAGPVGSLLGIYLADRGHEIDIYERRPDPRLAGDSEGRSINLALSCRGFDALAPVGIKDAIMALATPMRGRTIHAVDGTLNFQPYGKDDSEVIYAVSRGELNRALLTAAESRENLSIYFNQRCQKVNPLTKEANLRDEITGEKYVVSAETIFGTDGANSAVRRSMSKLPRISIYQHYIEYGYKELTIPAGANGSYQIEKNSLHIWPRGGYMLIALPNLDGSFTCTLFFPFEGAESFEHLHSQESVESFFKRVFPDAYALIPDLLKQYLANPVGALATIKIDPWHIDDSVILVGDSAHGIVPFLGQGLNCAFESVVELIGFLDQSTGDWKAAFKEYNLSRKPDTDAVADMALDNFIEMRDRVADAKFLLKKNVELMLDRRFSPKFIGRYAMIQFHRIPYSVAQKRGQINEAILADLCAQITSADQLDWAKAEELINTLL